MAHARSGNGGRLQPGPAFGWFIAVAMLAVVTPIRSPGSEPAGALATDSCCGVVELRQYTLRPGQREEFIALFDSTFAVPLDATGMTVIGQFRDLDRPDRFVWIRGFQNMDVRPKELAAFYDSDLWRSHRNEANAVIVDSDNVLLLEPASRSSRLKDVPPRLPEGDAATDGGLIVATLYYTKPGALSDFARLFDRSLRPKTETAGARTVAAYMTSTHENNYPRLPTRLGEHIYVWIAGFASPQGYADYRVKLEADRDWARALWPSARTRLIRDPEVLRLTPTSRSRLRGVGSTGANTRGTPAARSSEAELG